MQIIFLAGSELKGAVYHTCHGQEIITCMFRMFNVVCLYVNLVTVTGF